MTSEEFSKFRHESIHALMRLNESCDSEFQLSSWPRWDYDFERATLTFSKDNILRVLAHIQVVGTTSQSSGTWLWSWANDGLPSEVTDLMLRVRAFGEKENLAELIDPSATDDEYLGGAMTAITARILDSKGAYRCPGEDGFIYLVYTDISLAEKRNSQPEENQIQCSTHGGGYGTHVCEHLISNPEQLWFSDNASELKRCPDAWCAACDREFQEQGEWNDRNESKITIQLLCHRCYESLRARSQAAPQ
jgi:hypothetical protein